MPLHDWSELEGWGGVHDVWLVELLRSVQTQLPTGYRAHLGSSPGLKVDADLGKPDVAVRHWNGGNGNGSIESTEPSCSRRPRVPSPRSDGMR